MQSKIMRGFEGYSKYLTIKFDGEEHLTFAGYGPIEKPFTFRFSIHDNEKQLCQTSITLSDEEAVQLEEVLEREKKQRRIKSETYYNESIYMTCIVGGHPILSFTNQGTSITFMNDQDYETLYNLVKEYNSSIAVVEKGSKKWIQVVINDKPELINECVLNRISSKKINWVSPIKVDNYAEYSDNVFLEKLGLTLKHKKLDDFWPKGGPKWDALGKSDDDKILLVEAKSHIGEILIGGTRATSEESIGLISRSLEEVKDYLNARKDMDWTQNYYQYLNRIAHLYILRENGINAYLVLVYFVNDKDMNGPETIDEWMGAIKLMNSYLGLRRHKLEKYIIECFIDVTKI